MLLSKKEIWKSINDCNTSSASTVTVNEAGSFENLSDFTNNLSIEEPNRSLTENNNRDTSLLMPKINELNKVNQNTWNAVEIPWHRLNKKVLDDCEKGNRDKSFLDAVAHVAVDAAREIKLHVPTSVFKKITRKAVNKYPSMFQDVDDDGVVIGDGSHTFYKKLCDRNAYLNRPFKRPNVENVISSPKQVKLQINRISGCSNWQPQQLDGNPETLQEKKTILNNMFPVFTEETLNLLDETYTLQRMFINNPLTTIDDIKKEWPILFSQKGALWHFKKLMQQDIEVMEATFLRKMEKFINFGIRKKYVNNAPDDEEARIVMSLKIIASFLKDDIHVLFTEMDKLQELEGTVKTTSPCVVHIRGIYKSSKVFKRLYQNVLGNKISMSFIKTYVGIYKQYLLIFLVY